jgi:glycosyltransferase involved in cell wall biosynthesis
MVGSAPWSRKQFRTKGLDLLLRALEARPGLRLILLWRGVLGEVLRRKLDRRGLTDRVEVLDRQVDVARVFERAHAAVVLAARPHLVKPFPHSLLEALACRRPVLVSRTLDMARMIEETGSGLVVEELDLGTLLSALDRLRSGYEDLRRRIEAVDLSEFSQTRFLEVWERIYREAVRSDSADDGGPQRG